MVINFYSKIILKLLGISLFIPFTLFEINLLNKQIKAEKNLIAASEKDLLNMSELPPDITNRELELLNRNIILYPNIIRGR